MKTTRKIYIKKKLFLLLIILYSHLLIISQSNLTFSHNISIPDNSDLDYASGALDIISANNKIFVYTMHKIIVLDNSGNIVDYIPFDVDKRYGKFNPVYHNPRLQVTDIQLMTRFEEFEQEDLLVVTPNLDIMYINTNTLESDSWLSIPSSDPNLSHLAPLHGVCILKYEPINKRLFWLIKGRQEEPVANNPSCVGNFHYREVYFGAYNYSNSTLSRYDFLHYLTVSDNHPEYRNKNISDFEINAVNGNFFYLAKFNKIEIWEITDTGFDLKHTVETESDIYGFHEDDPGEPLYYKFSKLVYINDGSTHKIAALPYEYSSGYELQPGKVPFIYIIDCDNYTAQRETINAPNVRIIDGVYLPQTNELAICFSKDPDDQIEKVIINELEYESDIAVYNFDPGTSNWLQQKALLSSDNTTPIPEIDVNSPYNMMVMGNEVLVSKQDEIVRLHYVGSQYTTSSIGLIDKENNFFGKGTSILDNGILKGYIINKAGGKIEKFSKQSGNSIVYNGALRISYPVNHITSSNDGEILFYFNKLNIEGGGFFVYNADDGSVFNVNDDTPTNNDFTSPVGDCIYNNFNNEFLVSENKDFGDFQCATIKRYNPDGTIIAQAINLEFGENIYQNAKEMYIDNNGVLNIMVNTRVGDINNPNHPTLIQLDATSTNYSLIAEHQISPLPVSTNTAEFYSTHFCSSISQNTLFLTVTPQEISMPSYHSEFNSMYNPNRDPNNGYLYSIMNGQLIESDITFKNPGKIICPDDGNENHQSVFEGKVYILSDKLNVHDYTSKSSGFSNKKLNDIIYSPKHDRMFALADEIGLAECITDRASIVYEVTKSSNGYTFTELITVPGQSAAFFINEFDNRLYLHTKFDNKKLGETPSKLTPYNLETNLIEAAITLQNNTFQQNRCVYPELDNNHDYHYFVYNLNTPYIDHYRNKIYLPNGANSNVSVVDITDYLPLTQGYNWISIPRHLRDYTTGSTKLEDVFDNGNFTNGYTELDIYHYDAHPEAEPNGYTVTWDVSNKWVYDPDPDDYISQVRSRKGYKIKVGNSSNSLRLTGELENPISSMYLYQNDTNWAGYFLQQKQNIFDALGEFEQDLSYIKHRNYYCFRNHNIIEGQPIALYPWYCNSLNTDIEYGEMVILKPVSDIVGFKWSNTGISPTEAEEQAPEYFTYDETIDYTAFIIELDSTQNPVELGAMVNDSCIGAAVVQPYDSLVIIQAYLGAQSGDSVVFEEYTGNKSTEKTVIKDYFVLNEKNNTHEKRIIRTGENKDRYFISFKNKNTAIPEDLIDMVNIYPNPVKNQLNIDYQTREESNIEIIIFDAMGRKCAILLKTTQPKGTYSIYWDLNNSGNRKVKNGIYIIQLKINNDIVNKKVIVN